MKKEYWVTFIEATEKAVPVIAESFEEAEQKFFEGDYENSRLEMDNSDIYSMDIADLEGNEITVIPNSRGLL